MLATKILDSMSLFSNLDNIKLLSTLYRISLPNCMTPHITKNISFWYDDNECVAVILSVW